METLFGAQAGIQVGEVIEAQQTWIPACAPNSVSIDGNDRVYGFKKLLKAKAQHWHGLSAYSTHAG
jgi:hypothetical protein